MFIFKNIKTSDNIIIYNISRYILNKSLHNSWGKNSYSETSSLQFFKFTFYQKYIIIFWRVIICVLWGGTLNRIH